MFDFGLRIQQLRTNNRMSQKEFGKKIHRSKSVVSSYENNLRTPPLDILVDIATLFNVSLDYLVGIDKKEMFSVDGLDTKQKEVIQALIYEFKSEPVRYPGLTDSQQEILNKLIVEFAKKHK